MFEELNRQIDKPKKLKKIRRSRDYTLCIKIAILILTCCILSSMCSVVISLYICNYKQLTKSKGETTHESQQLPN